jgi:transposase-like protein
MGAGRPSSYSEEFRRDAIALVRSSGRAIAQITDESRHRGSGLRPGR